MRTADAYGCLPVGASVPASPPDRVWYAADSAAAKMMLGLSGEIVLQRAGYGCIDHLARHEHTARTGDADEEARHRKTSGPPPRAR